MSDMENLRPTSLAGIKRLATRIKRDADCTHSEALNQAARRAEGNFQNYADAQRTLSASDFERGRNNIESSSAPKTPMIPSMTPRFPEETPEQEALDELYSQFNKLQDQRQELRHDRAYNYFRSSGGSNSDWNYIEPSQAMEIAYHESEDEEAIQQEEDITEHLSSIEYGIQEKRDVTDELKEAEELLQNYTDHLGVGDDDDYAQYPDDDDDDDDDDEY